MGIFYRSAPLKPVVKEALQEAIAINPGAVADPQRTADEKAEQVVGQVSGRFAWGRLAVAVGLLVAVLVACIYTGQNEKLQELYKLLLHSFELLLGAVIGLLTGEMVSQPR
jgi:hypothetical protein